VKALRHPGLLSVAVTALLYNVGFFTLLAFAPFPLALSTAKVGCIFFGWGVLLALTSVFAAPWLEARIGLIPSVAGALVLFAADLAAMAIWKEHKRVLVVGIIVAGAFLGINNTLITQAVMGSAPVERPVASAAYSFVRFSGGAVAPYAAGKLGEHVSVHAPFWMGAVAVLLGAIVITTLRRTLSPQAPAHVFDESEAELIAVGDID